MNILLIDKKNSERGYAQLIIMLDAYIFDPPWNQRQWETEIENESNRVFLALGEPEETPAGFMSYGISGDSIELKKIGVLHDFRHNGVASLLLERLIQDARLLNANNIIAEVAITNLGAIKLYNKFAFHKIGVRKKYYNNTVDALILQKEV